MLRYAVIFFIIAVIAAVLGFGGIAAGAIVDAVAVALVGAASALALLATTAATAAGLTIVHQGLVVLFVSLSRPSIHHRSRMHVTNAADRPLLALPPATATGLQRLT